MLSRALIPAVFAVAILEAGVGYAGSTPTPFSTPTPTITATPTPTITATPSPSPTPCNVWAVLDKRCSVEGGPTQDACEITAGREVTYEYWISIGPPYSALFEVTDDQLGVIGEWTSGRPYLSRTVTLTETTTNRAEMSLVYLAPGCHLSLDCCDSVTVTVSRRTPTPTPTFTPTVTPTPTATASPTPTPTALCPFSEYPCTIDKKCSVGGSAPQDSCVAVAGEEVTYTYQVDTGGDLRGCYNVIVEVEDDRLGVIGETGTGTLSRATTLSETTTNTVTITDLGLGGVYKCRDDSDFDDTTTVTVIIPTPTATPTPLTECVDIWPVTKVCTIGKGQSASNNAKLSHCITGNVVNPSAIGATAHRIPVCRGTGVTSLVTDTTGTPTNTSDGSLTCDATACSGVVNGVEKYKSVSQDGKDTDRMVLIPE